MSGKVYLRAGKKGQEQVLDGGSYKIVDETLFTSRGMRYRISSRKMFGKVQLIEASPILTGSGDNDNDDDGNMGKEQSVEKVYSKLLGELPQGDQNGMRKLLTHQYDIDGDIVKAYGTQQLKQLFMKYRISQRKTPVVTTDEKLEAMFGEGGDIMGGDDGDNSDDFADEEMKGVTQKYFTGRAEDIIQIRNEMWTTQRQHPACMCDDDGKDGMGDDVNAAKQYELEQEKKRRKRSGGGDMDVNAGKWDDVGDDNGAKNDVFITPVTQKVNGGAEKIISDMVQDKFGANVTLNEKKQKFDYQLSLANDFWSSFVDGGKFKYQIKQRKWGKGDMDVDDEQEENTLKLMKKIKKLRRKGRGDDDRKVEDDNMLVQKVVAAAPAPVVVPAPISTPVPQVQALVPVQPSTQVQTQIPQQQKFTKGGEDSATDNDNGIDGENESTSDFSMIEVGGEGEDDDDENSMIGKAEPEEDTQDKVPQVQVQDKHGSGDIVQPKTLQRKIVWEVRDV